MQIYIQNDDRESAKTHHIGLIVVNWTHNKFESFGKVNRKLR